MVFGILPIVAYTGYAHFPRKRVSCVLSEESMIGMTVAPGRRSSRLVYHNTISISTGLRSESACYDSFFRPTIRRYVGLLSFLYPPSLQTGFCTFTILSSRRDPIWLPPVLYDMHLVVRYDLPCTIHIYEPPIRLLVALVEFRFPST